MRHLRTLLLVLVIGLTLCMSVSTTFAAVAPVPPSVVPSEPFGIAGSNWNGVAHISWQEPNQTGPGITRYDVYREINGTGAEQLVQLNATERQYDDRMPASAVNVTYWIVAENSVGKSNASRAVTLVPSAYPAAPTSLRAVAGLDYVDISWSSPSSNGGNNITAYIVRRQMASSGEAVELDVMASRSSIPITSVHDDQASSGDVYTYNIKAVSNQSESAWSDSVTVTSPPKNINDNSGILSVFALVLAVIAIQIAIVAIYVVVKRKAFKPKTP
jgi:hypothetical protein